MAIKFQAVAVRMGKVTYKANGYVSPNYIEVNSVEDEFKTVNTELPHDKVFKTKVYAKLTKVLGKHLK